MYSTSLKVIFTCFIALLLIATARQEVKSVDKFNNDKVISGWQAPWDKSLGAIQVTGGIYSHKDQDQLTGTYRRAVDFGMNENTNVLASFEGKVVTSRWLGNVQRGLIVIEHDRGVVAGYCSVYLHLNLSAFGWSGNSKPSVEVVTGQYLGKSGSGWGATHLHFAVYEQFHPNGHYNNNSYCNDYSPNDAHKREVIPHFFNNNRDPRYLNEITSYNSMIGSVNDSPTPAPVAPGSPYRTFSDVPLYTDMSSKTVNEFFPYVEVLVDMGAVTKNPQYNVGSITKEEFVKLLIIAMGVSTSDENTGCVFNDVCHGTSFYRYIKRCKEMSICGGDNGSFNPTHKMNRYATAKFVSLGRDRREPSNCLSRPYDDVPIGDTFCRYVQRLKTIYASEGEVLDSDRIFSGDSPISRLEATRYIVIGLGEKHRIPRFWDVWHDSPFYDWVMDNYNEGVINGCQPNLYCAHDNATPGQIAKMLVEGMGEARTYSDGYKPFADVPTSDTFYRYIRRLTELGKGTGLFEANPAAYFGTNDTATRYRAVEMIAWALRIKGYTCDPYMPQRFSDAPPNLPNDYYNSVQCAASFGIIHGRSDGKFHGSDPVNRLELAKMIALGVTYRFKDETRPEPGDNSDKRCGLSTRNITLNPLQQAYVRITGGDSKCYNVINPNMTAASMEFAALAGSSSNKQVITFSPALLGLNTNFTLELLDDNQQLVKKVAGISPFNPVELTWDANKDTVTYLRVTNDARGAKSNYAYFSVDVESSVCNAAHKVCASQGNDPSFAVDDNPLTSWSARGFAPQWYEMDLGSQKQFYGLSVVLEQSPAGNTTFTIFTAGDDRIFEEYHTFNGFTQAGSDLNRREPTPRSDVRFVRIHSVSSPSWISFNKVQIFTQEESNPETPFFRTWDGVTIRQQTTTSCQDTQLAVYLADMGSDGMHIIVHRENAPEAFDHRLITGPASHSLAVSGCEIRLTQGSMIALHVLEPTGNSTYAWRIRFLNMESPSEPTAPLGDVSCDSDANVTDASWILQYDVGLRQAADSCPLPPDTILLDACDVNGDGACDVRDALWLLQCSVGLSNGFCPAASALAAPPAAPASTPARLYLEQSGGQTTIMADLQDNTLGAATIELHYKPTHYTLTGCTSDPDHRFNLGLCNPTYGEGVARFNVVAGNGVTGVAPLAQVTFEPPDPATSLQVRVVTFAGVDGAPIVTAGEDSEINIRLLLPFVQR